MIEPKILITVSIVAVLLLQSCGGSGSSPRQAVDSTKNSGVDFEELKKSALAFVPQIGKTGGEIVLPTLFDPKSFNPVIATEDTTTEFTSYIYEGLIRLNGATLLPEPNLASSWDVSENGLEWTFHIRPGVLWSDGKPFSAYDVEFTFNELIYNTAITTDVSRELFLIDGKRVAITVPDSLTVRFILPAPYAPFLRALTQEILPRHCHAKFVKKGTFSTELGIRTPPDQMVGTGPFLLESYRSSQKIVFKRNPNYWKTDSAGTRLPYLDRVVYTIVSDRNTGLLQFKRGQVDFFEAGGEEYADLAKDAASSKYTVWRLGPATGSDFLVFNQNRDKNPASGNARVDSIKWSWFTNVNFRRAVAHALDKQLMIDIAANGLGYPQWSPMSPSEGYFYNGGVAEYPYDVAKAKKLLAGEGFADRNRDSVVEDAAGHPVEFSLVTNGGNAIRGKIAEIIRNNLVSIGFRVHYHTVDFDSLIGKLGNPPFGWDAALIGLAGGAEPNSAGNVWRSNGALHVWYLHQKTPATPWEAAIDSLFDLGIGEYDNGKRRAIYNEWQRIAAEQLPMIATVLPERILCITNKFGNLNPTLCGGLQHNIEYVFVK